MIKLYLNETIREQMLNFDIENSEHSYDRDMFYITNSEKDILRNIIHGWGEMLLEKIGFHQSDIDLIMNDEIDIEFSNKRDYYIIMYNY